MLIMNNQVDDMPYRPPVLQSLQPLSRVARKPSLIWMILSPNHDVLLQLLGRYLEQSRCSPGSYERSLNPFTFKITLMRMIDSSNNAFVFNRTLCSLSLDNAPVVLNATHDTSDC
jgi:hypothetical protein